MKQSRNTAGRAPKDEEARPSLSVSLIFAVVYHQLVLIFVATRGWERFDTWMFESLAGSLILLLYTFYKKGTIWDVGIIGVEVLSCIIVASNVNPSLRLSTPLYYSLATAVCLAVIANVVRIHRLKQMTAF